jgi:hypothetical protein
MELWQLDLVHVAGLIAPAPEPTTCLGSANPGAPYRPLSGSGPLNAAGKRPASHTVGVGCRHGRQASRPRRTTGPRPGESGSYIDQGKITPSSPASYDKDREEELWTTAARLTGLDQKV